MVFKVSKGGVRSGNTLRGLRCLRTKRYSRQACIVGRSSLPPTELSDLLESSGADECLSSSLGATDTILSLNKKERWLLPVALHDMIKTDRFNSGKTVVSLLERHKLKRTSNCVSFICNQGKIRHVVPRQKRYFSFNPEKIGAEQSNRQRKLQNAKMLKAVKAPQVKIRRSRQSGLMKTVDLFTISGSNNPETNSNEESQKRFYQLEVFYPCPQSCSLVYNPKYTNVPNTNEEGDTQVKSNIKSTRAKRKHRKRISSKDIKIMYQDTTDNWEEDFSDDDDLAVEDSQNVDEDNSATNLESNHDVSYGGTLTKSGIQESSNIFANLITEAEKAKSLCDRQGRVQRRKPPGSSSYGQERFSDKVNKPYILYADREDQVSKSPTVSPNKSHIVYIDREVQVSKPPTVSPNKLHIMNTDREVQVSKSPTVSPQGQSKPILNSARVIMASEEVDPEKLRAKYGSQYAEADSVPRRFVINVTDDVQNLVSTSRNSNQNARFTSFLVFIHDGFYDEGLDSFHVIFNSNICAETLKISQNIPFEQMSVEDIMNCVVCSLLDMKQENRLLESEARPCEFMSKPSLSFLYEAVSVRVQAFHAGDEISRVSRAGVMQEKTSWSANLNNVVDNIEWDMFCDICYENINQTQVGTATGTELSPCGHRFCDDCWRLHFRGQFKDGAAKMVCPGYDCKVIVGPVTLLSLLHVSEVSQLFQRVYEEDAEASPHCRWCPNPSCGRIVKLERRSSASNMSHDINCVCGQEFCFLCLSQPHWPASCEQAEAYTENLQTLSPPKEADDELPSSAAAPIQHAPKNRRKNDFLEVEGRVCPKCSRFIEKRGGCQHISCKCGNDFCWLCMKNWFNHGDCKPNSFIVFEYTRRLKIKHLVIPNTGPTVTSSTPPADSEKRSKSRHRITMSQKALQQRLEATAVSGDKRIREMVNKMIRISQKDLLFKRELFNRFNVEVKDTDNADLPTIVPHVTKFLRSCVDIKRALHHVAEFSFVLIQDIPDSVDRRRILRLANDLSGYCSFIKSILELGQNQDVKAAVRRLLDIQLWARRALVILMSSVNLIRS